MSVYSRNVLPLLGHSHTYTHMQYTYLLVVDLDEGAVDGDGRQLGRLAPADRPKDVGDGAGDDAGAVGQLRRRPPRRGGVACCGGNRRIGKVVVGGD